MSASALPATSSAGSGKIEAQIRDYPQILECQAVSGDYDYLLKVVARDLKSPSTFLTDRLMQVLFQSFPAPDGYAKAHHTSKDRLRPETRSSYRDRAPISVRAVRPGWFRRSGNIHFAEYQAT